MDPERESRDSVEAEWGFQARAATQWDDRSRGSATTWVPPIMGALVDAARNSALGQFYPFTSHARLCFSTGRRHWLGEGDVLPVCIALLPGGSYSVAHKYDPADLLLETTSADEAVATAVTALQEYLQAYGPDRGWAVCGGARPANGHPVTTGDPSCVGHPDGGSVGR
ncbi:MULTISPECIES: DUF6193 family natural product biosynthesis protein [unclassified Streptomyces]|uniref:DUF6193 family natural product biosynthesis protein n=1 Tax=unclassified Streptomyces TaxID=2593676 RepID=UPI003BA8AC35